MEAKRLTLEAFERLLDAYGSDPGRWPSLQRADALALVDRDTSAARLLAEARALDGVLAEPPITDRVRIEPLANRIFAAAFSAAYAPAIAEPHDSEPRHDASAGAPSTRANVIRLPVRPRPSPSAPSLPASAGALPPRTHREPGMWRAATALAASLIFGIMLGVADLAPTSAFGLGASAEAASGDAEALLAVLHGSGLQSLDEDEQ